MESLDERMNKQLLKRISTASNSKGERAKSAHRLYSPDCKFYDGNAICPAWRSWILSGRNLYSTVEEYIRHINSGRHIPVRDIKLILKEGYNF